MNAIGSFIAMTVGFFILPISAAIVEFIINKSVKKNWGYKVSITLLILQLLIMAVVKLYGPTSE